MQLLKQIQKWFTSTGDAYTDEALAASEARIQMSAERLRAEIEAYNERAAASLAQQQLVYAKAAMAMGTSAVPAPVDEPPKPLYDPLRMVATGMTFYASQEKGVYYLGREPMMDEDLNPLEPDFILMVDNNKSPPELVLVKCSLTSTP